MENINKEECLVSVIVPAYNHEKYILDCLDSIQNQTYRDFQWIIVDDCSSDSTPQILINNQKKYGYELILHKKNIGVSATMTEMIRDYAKGKYISSLASDDMYMPQKIERQLRFMEENPQYGMCYSRNLIMDTDGRVIGKEDGSNYKSGWVFQDILALRFHPGTCLMIKKDVIEDIGFYKGGVIAEDYYINCHIADKYQIGFLDEYLGKYRAAPTGSKRDPMALVMSHKEVLDMYKDRVEYGNALKHWKMHSSGIISSYAPYKMLALKYLLQSFLPITNIADIHFRSSIIRNLLFRWEVIV